MVETEALDYQMPTRDSYMFHSRSYIEVGDLVIAYMTRDKMEPIIVTPGEVLHNKFGKYNHSDMVGVKFGSRITSPAPTPGFIHLLRPTPELWTLSLPHRTQILYNADIAFILQELGVRKGARVVEAGTGSGSMSHALARVVGPKKEGKKGGVWSFEYHRTRYEKALEEFSSHGLLDNPITLQHRNVCKDGFGDIPGGVDSVFLDVPAPWEAIPHAVKILRSDTLARVCTFSPCLEQVTRTLTALSAHGFTNLQTHEVLTRAWEIPNIQPGLPGGAGLVTVKGITTKLRERASRKEERRLIQIYMAKEKKKESEAKEPEAAAGEEEEEEAMMTMEVEPVPINGSSGSKRPREDSNTPVPSSKKPKLDIRELEEEEADAAPTLEDPESHLPVFLRKAPPPTAPVPTAAGPLAGKTHQSFNFRRLNPLVDVQEEEDEDWVLKGQSIQAKPVQETRGHTSYLTFAVMYPKAVMEELEALYPEKVKNGGGKTKGKATSREGSYDTITSGGEFDQAIATLTEEELMGMSAPALS